tara:strand:+ start:17377 stop:17562 length:186 start_codon:yes stop_codon:yes gene_type:complete
MIKEMFRVVIGLIFVIITLISLTNESWYLSVLTVIKGTLVIALFFIGIGLIFWGLSELKEA